MPVLWDKKTGTIVNNESSEIIRIFNSQFNDLVSPDKATIDLYPQELREEIDALNAWVYDGVNSCVLSYSVSLSAPYQDSPLNGYLRRRV